MSSGSICAYILSGQRRREKTALKTLHIGVGWYPEQAGNGLDRMFHGLACHLPSVGVGVKGLVVGSERASSESSGRVHAVASEKQSLIRRLWSFRRAMSALLREGGVDLVASHFALYTLPIYDFVEDQPFVVHFHGPWAEESAAEGQAVYATKAKAAIERLVYAKGARFIVLSEAFAELLSREYRVPRERVRVVPGGVDVDRFNTGLSRNDARERLGWPTDRPVLLSVRRLVRRVGLEVLIDAFNAVREHVPDSLLLIGGKGPLEAELRTRIREANLEQNVRLLGFIAEDDLPLAYRAADLSVVPTLALEGFGLIAAESLAAGTSPIVTPVGGLPEVVRGLSEALVLSDCSRDALADHLVQALMGTLEMPSTMECQEFARSRYSWTNVAAQLREVYEEVL